MVYFTTYDIFHISEVHFIDKTLQNLAKLIYFETKAKNIGEIYQRMIYIYIYIYIYLKAEQHENGQKGTTNHKYFLELISVYPLNLW